MRLKRVHLGMKMEFKNNGLKNGIVFLLALLWSLSSFSQPEKPVLWDVSLAMEGMNANLIFSAKIDEGWHLYATHLDSDEGPIPTEFVYDEASQVFLAGDLNEEEPIEKYDPNFDMEVRYFEHQTTFVQPLKFSGEAKAVKGYITYMVCNDERCLPPVDEPFEVTIE